MNKYGPKAQEHIGNVLHKYEKGTLRSSSGNKVTNKQQALAIGISESRRKGYKTPHKG